MRHTLGYCDVEDSLTHMRTAVTAEGEGPSQVVEAEQSTMVRAAEAIRSFLLLWRMISSFVFGPIRSRL